MITKTEIEKRCTFAIISHPDAGKTTMTEKLLWYGRVVRDAGMVKSKSGHYAKSDWMELEKQRGISVTSSVMSFEYEERALHLLDTPGHKDFSEDTYRTLTAVESVLMMIDSAKGVETQTQKLMEVCRLRDTPIVTYMNKFDRDAMDPFELIDNIEKICSIQCCPLTWPIGSGNEFKGVINLKTRQITSFKESKDPFSPTIIDASHLDSPEVVNFIGDALLEKLKEDLAIIHEMMPTFNIDEFLAGIQTPLFFGSALYNFGVKETLDFMSQFSPAPQEKTGLLSPFKDDSEQRIVSPNEKKFTGMIFKIQANMDKKHRDRMAFMRVCSGVFKKGNKVLNVRTNKEIKINAPVIFQSRDRDITERAYPGDIIGLPGHFQIGDTLTEGEKIKFTGIPNFAPEIFMKVLLKEPLKGKQLDKGLQQLSEEGTVQLFTKIQGKEKILGAVGTLQFDVVKFRLEDEYNVKGEYQGLSLQGIRWPKFPNKKVEKEFIEEHIYNIAYDRMDRICYLVKDMWELKIVMDKNKDITFYNNSDYI